MSTARTKKRAAEAAGFTIKLALGLVFISPLIIGLFFSFQTEQELMSYPLHLLPQHFTLENYQAVFAKVPLLLYLKNSVIVCVIAIFAQVIFANLIVLVNKADYTDFGEGYFHILVLFE